MAYIAPLRSDAERPYIAAEYEAFKQDTAAIAAEAGARFLDLEPLVPNEFWGQKDSTSLDGAAEIDFMHFQSPGHELLARTIETAVQEALDDL